MIAFLRGRLAARGPDWAHVDVGGVGYLAHVPASSRLPAVGAEVTLQTTLVVREDAMMLFGFVTAEEQTLFNLCCAVGGVGPKTALALVSALPPDRLRRAVLTEDLAVLTAVPGIGRKTAQRLILELSEKLGGEPAEAVVAGSQDAVAALLALGYSASEAVSAVNSAEAEGASETGEIVRRALRHLGGAA